MQDPVQGLPLVADVDPEGQAADWIEPDGTPVRVINGKALLHISRKPSRRVETAASL
jgi:hypothetical protein